MNGSEEVLHSDEVSIRVLLVDDEELFLQTTAAALDEFDCQVFTSSSGHQAVEKIESALFDVVVLDISMPEMDGLETLKKIKESRPSQEVVMLSGQATVPQAIQAMKLGAFDFMLKPYQIDDLIRIIRHASERGKLERRNLILTQELVRSRGTGEIIGQSNEIAKVQEFIDMAATSDRPVLITGESGTGKELVARAIHQRSLRSSNSLVVVDGSTLREELLASELFGHEKGAFTGAVTRKVGLFEVADRGTIFLDEIGELSPSNQASLLRVIEYGTFRPVGAVSEIKTDVRIIASTNKRIEQAVKEGSFREDLYYRLNGLAIRIPPLRERKGDISILCNYFLSLWNQRNRSMLSINQEAMAALEVYHWPGNVREVINVMELAALQARNQPEISLANLPDVVRNSERPGESRSKKGKLTIEITTDDLRLNSFHDQAMRTYFTELLAKHNGNKSQVAREAGISRALLYQKLRRLGIP